MPVAGAKGPGGGQGAGVAVGTDRGHGSTLTARRHEQGVNDLGPGDQGLRDMGQDPLPPASYLPTVPSTS